MESYLVVKNSKGEKCVCSQIVKHSDGQTHHIFHYNNSHRGETVVIDNCRIINHIAGNLTELNPLDCFYSVIGIPSIIVITLSIGDNDYNLFRLGDDLKCCDLNSWLKIGDIEKKIIEDYSTLNSKQALPTYQHNAYDFTKILFMCFGGLIISNNEGPILPWCHKVIKDEIITGVTKVKIDLIDCERLVSQLNESQLKLLEKLTIRKSSAHRIKVAGNCIEIMAPISWSGGHSIGHDFDGLYQRHYGYQDIARIEFDVSDLSEKYLEKIKKLCREQDIELKEIEVNRFSKLYEFNGYVEQFGVIREEQEYDDYYEPNLQLPEW